MGHDHPSRLLGVVSLVLVAAAITNPTLRGQGARFPIATQEDFQRAMKDRR